VSISVIDCFGATHIMRPLLKSLRNEDSDYFIRTATIRFAYCSRVSSALSIYWEKVLV
jgi:hypothetical protein